jgi:hypothetical protein
MDVATLRVYGLYGFGFFIDNEVNVVVQYLLDILIDFRLYTDATPFVAIHPPPAPTSSPARSDGDGAEGPANVNSA